MKTTDAPLLSQTPTASSMGRRLAVDVASAAMSPAAPRTPTGSDGGVEAPFIFAQLPASVSPLFAPSGGAYGSPSLVRARGGESGAHHAPQWLPTPPNRASDQRRSVAGVATYSGLASIASPEASASRSEVVSLVDCGRFDERTAESQLAPVEAPAGLAAGLSAPARPPPSLVAVTAVEPGSVAGAGAVFRTRTVEGPIISSDLNGDTAAHASVAVRAADAALTGGAAALTVEVASVDATSNQERAPLSPLRIPPTRPPFAAAASPFAAAASHLAAVASPLAAAAASPGGAVSASSAMFAAAAAGSPAKRWVTPAGQLDGSTALHFLVVDDGECCSCCSSRALLLHTLGFAAQLIARSATCL
jgi:hypothetical protein